MNKAELIEVIAEEAGLTKASATRALNAVIDSIVESVSRREQVTLVGFGTFTCKERSARKGRNPRTGEEINIPGSTVPVFRPGAAYKKAVNG